MSCSYTYKGKDYSEKELLTVLSHDPKLIKKYGNKQNIGREAYTKESIDVFNEKVDQLKKSMDVDVILDDTIDSSRVLGKGDKRVKDAGKPVILINPNQLFRETAIHEFSHIFLDSFPNGLKNPRIKKALNQLKGTELESEVMELYPDLNEEMLAKEIIATAMGREGADIWEDAESVSAWKTFKDWFISFINRTFGIPRNEVISMTQEMLSGKNIQKDLLAGIPMTDQRLVERRRDKNKSKKTSSLQSVYNEVLSRMTNVYNLQKPRNSIEIKAEKERSKKGPTRFETVEELTKQMEKFDKIDQQLGLSKYVDWVTSELHKMKEVLDKRKINDTLTKDKILASIQWENTFTMIDDIQDLSQKLHEDGTLSDEDKVIYDKQLKSIQGLRSELKSELLYASREVYAKFLAENDNEVREGYKLGYARDFKDLNLKEAGLEEEQYVLEQLNINAEEIKDRTYTEALERSKEISRDISWFAATFLSEKNANSKDIQVLSKVVDSADRNIDEYASDQASQFDKNNKEFRTKIGEKLVQSKKYDPFIYKSESGSHYYASEYKAEFNEERMSKINDAADRDLFMEKYKDVSLNEKGSYTIKDGDKTRKAQIKWYGAHSFEFTKNGMHVTFTQHGERLSITKEQAIAKSEQEYWINSNTEKIFVDGVSKFVPIQSWKNELYFNLTKEEKDQLNWFKSKIRDADDLTQGSNSLIKKSYNQEWIKLPSVLRSGTQRLAEGNIKDFFEHKYSELTQRQKDDYESGEVKTSKDSVKVLANLSNREKLSVPVKFRAKILGDDQSLDLHTITLMNTVAAKEYSEKKKLEATFLIILEVMKGRKVRDTAGVMRLKKLHLKSNEDNESPIYKDPKDGLSEETKKAMGILENRIYGIKNIETGDILGKNINQLTRSWLKYSGTVALLGNWANSIINYNMGTVSNFIEGMGGEHFTVKDLAKARKTYWMDIKNILDDMSGKVVNTSRTNLFMNMFNVAGGREYMDNKFEETTRFQALMKMNNMRPIAKGGEHMMQSQLMYAVMHNIKVMNKDGKFIDRDGNVVSKKKAASLDEMIEFTKDEVSGSISMDINPMVNSTSFTLTGGREAILLETRNLIKNKVLELHGNYDSDVQAEMQRQFYGKLLYFLRKWTLPGIQRRWRGLGTVRTKSDELTEADQFYSQDAKANREGYYVTALRFFGTVIFPAIRTLNLELIKKGSDKLTSHERANLIKVATELSLIVISWAAYLALDDDDDEDKNLTSRYILRRQISELSFFLNPVEAFKIFSTPTASVGTFKRILQVATQLMDPLEEYVQGNNKGRRKLTVKALKAFPISSQIEKDLGESLKFLTQMSF